MNTIKYLILILIVGAISFGGYYYISKKNNSTQRITSSVVINNPSITSAPPKTSQVFSVENVNVDNPATPTATPTTQIVPIIVPQPIRSTQISPDGTKEVISQTDTHSDGSRTFSLFISTVPFGEQPAQLIFSQTLDNQTLITTPFTTFSPDDQYIFLQENQQNATHYLVFKTSGAPFSNGSKYLDVSSLFNSYTSSYQLSAVTGWASDTLLIIETEVNGQPSTSFWFDVTNSSFTPLATRF